MLSQQGCFKRYSLLGTLSSTTRSDTPTLKLINEARALTIEHSIYYGWIDCKDTFRAVLFIMLHNGLKMSVYKAYWLMGFPLIKLLGVCQEIIMVIF